MEKNIALYIVSGIILIHILNIIRIALLSLHLYYYPEYEEILHGTIFPFSFMELFLFYGFCG
jgi:exosortase/archaeosortase family protein